MPPGICENCAAPLKKFMTLSGISLIETAVAKELQNRVGVQSLVIERMALLLSDQVLKENGIEIKKGEEILAG